MSIRDFYITLLSALIATPLSLLTIHSVGAQAMQSTNYVIESDSINFGGGLSSSTSYRLESTAGEVATGDRTSASYNLRGGYQQMTTTYISLSTPTSVTMTPSIPGVTGGVANGSTTVTVTTDSSAGYSLQIKASESPALRNGASTIADYVPSGNPDFAFTTTGGQAHFGYSPSGTDTADRFLDNGGACGVGSSDTALACWDGLDTTDEVIAESASANTPEGATTTVYFRVGVGGNALPREGVYTATTTLTALSL